MLRAVALRADRPTPSPGDAPAPPRSRWQGPLAGVVTVLVVAVPTMVVAEDWRGHPMIDDAGAWWLVPAALAAAAFIAGGAVAVRGWRSGAAGGLRRAGGTGALVGTLGSGILVAADGVRRLLVNPTLPAGVVAYWLEAAAVAIVASLLGAVVAVVRARKGVT